MLLICMMYFGCHHKFKFLRQKSANDDSSCIKYTFANKTLFDTTLGLPSREKCWVALDQNKSQWASNCTSRKNYVKMFHNIVW